MVLCLSGAVLGAALGSMASAPMGELALFMVGMVTLAMVGYRYPTLAKRPYAVMYRGFEQYCRLLRLCLKLACFSVFVVVGRAGSTLPLQPRTGWSMWIPRCSTPPDVFESEFEGKHDLGSTSWIATYVTWARRTGNGWAIMLLPFLTLLSALEPDEERSFPPNIYTLF